MSDLFKSSNQLQDYAKQKQQQNSGANEPVTTSFGCPVGFRTASLTAGPRGPILLQDSVLIDETAKFDRERIPERAVHAKGAGAFGYFEVTHDISKYCKANVFAQIGKRTPIAIRFSTVGGESGSADSVRDPRGFAVKFYTDEGIWDLVGNNTPIFFIRDPILFPSFIHTQKRNPVTHLKDKDMFWDFISLRPETSHQVSFLFSDRGIPDGYRHMNGYGSHTFKLVNKDGQFVWCKFHMKTNQGIKNLSVDKANELASSNPDYATQDLFEAIGAGQFPSWTMYIQVMSDEQAQTFKCNPFDLTKVWQQSEFPLIPVGRLVLDRNPRNYFADVEQIAFSPSHMPPGIEASPDKMLQARLFSYPDTQMHRLGPNHMQLPVNCPLRARNYQRDGAATYTDNQNGAPNYFPNSFSGPNHYEKFMESKFEVHGSVERYNTADDDNFTQAGIFWNKVLDDAQKDRLANNIAEHLSGAKEFIQRRAIENFSRCDKDYGNRIVKFMSKYKTSNASNSSKSNL